MKERQICSVKFQSSQNYLPLCIIIRYHVSLVLYCIETCMCTSHTVCKIIHNKKHPTQQACVCVLVLGKTVSLSRSVLALRPRSPHDLCCFCWFNFAVLPILIGSADMFEYDINQSTCVHLALCVCLAFENSPIHFNVCGHFRMTRRWLLFNQFQQIIDISFIYRYTCISWFADISY